MDHSQDIKAVAKELKFPGGKGLQKYPNAYVWEKRRGYAYSQLSAVHEAVKANGWKRGPMNPFLSPDGNVSYNDYVFYKGDFEVRIHASYGVTSGDNWFSMRLEKKKI